MPRPFLALVFASLAWLGAAALVVPGASAAGVPDTVAAADRLFALVNSERAAAGLPALARRAEVDAIAATHRTAMAAKGDLWHNDVYFSPATHQALGASYLGENVAMNRSIEDMHRRLMLSPHHRENILDPRFTQMGVAVAAAPDGVLYATEDFVQPKTVAAPKPAAPKPAATKPAAPKPLPTTTAPPAPSTTAAVAAPAVAAVAVAPPVRVTVPAPALAAPPPTVLAVAAPRPVVPARPLLLLAVAAALLGLVGTRLVKTRR
jgi:hypothetical protein